MSEDWIKPGEVWQLSEPQPVGKLTPVETREIEGEPKQGWTCHIRNGWEVKRYTTGDMERIANLPMEERNQAVQDLPNLQGEPLDDQVVLVMSLYGWVMAEVKNKGDCSGPCAETKHSLWPLRLSEDERNCWVTSTQINRSCFDPDYRKQQQERYEARRVTEVVLAAGGVDEYEVTADEDED